MGGCIRKRVVYDMSCKRFQFFLVNVEALLNSVFSILKLIPLFTVSDQKVTLSNLVNYKAYSLTSSAFACYTNTVYIGKLL